MWNISTYQWLQGIRYCTDSYEDLTEPFAVAYLPPVIAKIESEKIARAQSMENLKVSRGSYADCLVVPPHKISAEKTSNSAYFAKLLIQELVTQRRLSATMTEQEIEQLDAGSTCSSDALDRRWSADGTRTVSQDWALEENDLYNLDICLRIVDDSFEDILDDALSSSSEEAPVRLDSTTHRNVLDCDDELVTFENKAIPQSVIYQNIFELRRDQRKEGSTANRSRPFKIPEVLYENIWDFGSAGEPLEIKHGSSCRVSTIFDETCEELVVPEVLPLKCDLDYLIPECVNRWMKSLRYEYSWEDDEVLPKLAATPAVF